MPDPEPMTTKVLYCRVDMLDDMVLPFENQEIFRLIIICRKVLQECSMIERLDVLFPFQHMRITHFIHMESARPVQAAIILTVMLNDDSKDTVRGLSHLTCICTVSLHLVVSAC